ncbi:MAG: zf-HC2 domain-containing protein [Candidatus Omnitrophica bacterium]|nr:zf-HC2 domain-containing protein [Candidatus Omnitrophota bacterium]
MPHKQERIEKLIKVIYKKWKSAFGISTQEHPDEEAIACFLEDRLSRQEKEEMKAHLVNCDACAEVATLQMKIGIVLEREVFPSMIAYVKDLVRSKEIAPVLDILLKLRDDILEILNTTGDVLVGQELMAVSILRSRRIKEFKDEVLISKDFKDVRVEARIKNKHGKAFSLAVTVRNNTTRELMRDLRVTLFKGNKRIESYLVDSGKVIFEDVLLGRYKVQIASKERKLAFILLDIKR